MAPHPPPLHVVSLQPRPSFTSSHCFFTAFFDGRNTRSCDLRPLALAPKMQQYQHLQQLQRQQQQLLLL